ncbi:MAG: hypothetical protein NTX22_10550 [Ignavibacteriales bacterium]|nr:hypothetical protein [Ignavibacteriales bacterium]
MNRFYILLFVLITCASFAFAQQFSEAIEDNSFFIEEAYNQEDRVVQHITNGLYNSKPQKDFTFSFTQEWPFFSQKHQLSYTIPFYSYNSNSVSGIGDILVNYRYQLFYKEDWASASPRVSIIFPTGNYKKGLGNDVTGIQFNLPVSKRLTNYWIAHFNVGLTYIPNAKGYNTLGQSVKQNLVSYFSGISLIWLAKNNFNVMMEYLFNYFAEINEDGKTVHTSENIISPGLRYAIDIGDLQVVPGIAVPISITNAEARTGLFLYLSFEHPF